MGTNVNALISELNSLQTLLENRKSLKTKLDQVEGHKKEKLQGIVDSTKKKQLGIYTKKRADAKYKAVPSLKITGNEKAPYYIKTDIYQNGKRSLLEYANSKSPYTTSPNLMPGIFELQGRLRLGLAVSLLVFILISNIIMLILSFSVFGIIFSGFLRIVSFLGLCACGVMMYLKRNEYKVAAETFKKIEKNEHITKLVEWKNAESSVQVELEKYVNELDTDNYAKVFEGFFEEFKEFDKEYVAIAEDYYKEIAPIADECEKNLKQTEADFDDYQNKLENALYEVGQAIDSVTIIHPDMFPKIGKITQILTMGRADSIKEAINVMIEDEHREEMARRQEAEAARQREQMEIMERQARADAKAAKEQANAELKARQEAARIRCSTCRNKPSTGSAQCPWRVRNNFHISGDVCPAYRPE